MMLNLSFLGSIRGGSVPMAVGVQTDVCSPALANFGSHELKEQFLRPSVAGDIVGCLGVNEVDAGSDVASIKTKAVEQGGRWNTFFIYCYVAAIDFCSP